MRILYSLIIEFYLIAIQLAALFGNNKAKHWINGRKNLIQQYKNSFKNIKDDLYWIHVSSLGEFEQARPFIDELKKTKPQIKILLTFFSPSGFEIRKNYQNADIILYLPIDRYSKMSKICEIINPKAVFFAKYDFWFNLIKILNIKKIPVFYFSVIFRKDQYFFSFMGRWFYKHLKMINLFFVQNQETKEILLKNGITNSIITGDTRLDRVVEIAQANKDFPILESFCKNNKTLIAGSTWEADEKIIAEYLVTNKDLKLIIAPHNIAEERLKSIENLFKETCLRFSEINNTEINSRIIIIDSIGVLSSIYKYADIVLIGNGFGKGIHNILEPIVWGKPVVFGPNYHKFIEAVELVKTKGAYSFNNYAEFEFIVNKLLSDNNTYEFSKEQCIKYVENNQGATLKIFEQLEKHLPNFQNIL